jgi:hypothetical protein
MRQASAKRMPRCKNLVAALSRWQVLGRRDRPLGAALQAPRERAVRATSPPKTSRGLVDCAGPAAKAVLGGECLFLRSLPRSPACAVRQPRRDNAVRVPWARPMRSPINQHASRRHPLTRAFARIAANSPWPCSFRPDAANFKRNEIRLLIGPPFAQIIALLTAKANHLRSARIWPNGTQARIVAARRCWKVRSKVCWVKSCAKPV